MVWRKTTRVMVSERRSSDGARGGQPWKGSSFAMGYRLHLQRGRRPTDLTTIPRMRRVGCRVKFPQQRNKRRWELLRSLTSCESSSPQRAFCGHARTKPSHPSIPHSGRTSGGASSPTPECSLARLKVGVNGDATVMALPVRLICGVCARSTLRSLRRGTARPRSRPPSPLRRVPSGEPTHGADSPQHQAPTSRHRNRNR